MQAKNDKLEDLIKAKDLTILTLQHEVGFVIQEHTKLSGRLDRLLMPAPDEKKKWFEFWK